MFEIISELTNAGISLAEIAGLTDEQMAGIYFRPRDKHGMLIRGKEKIGEVSEDNPYPDGEVRIKKRVSYEAMYRQLWSNRGLSKEQVDAAWNEHLAASPSLQKFLQRGKRK